MSAYAELTEDSKWIKGIKIGSDVSDTITEADANWCELRAKREIDSKIKAFDDPIPVQIYELALMKASELALRLHARPQGSQGDSTWSRADWLHDEFQKWVDKILSGEMILQGDADFGGTETEMSLGTSDGLDENDKPREPIFNETGVEGIDRGIREDVDADGYTEYDTPGDIP